MLNENVPNAEQFLTARQWLCSGGGGFEDGEDGIRACTMSAENAIELMDKYREFCVRCAVVKERERCLESLKPLKFHFPLCIESAIDAIRAAKEGK